MSRGVTDSGKNCYGTPISDLKAKTAKEKELLLSKFSDKVSGYNIMWECKWNIFRNENKTLIDEFWRRSKLDPMRPLKRLIPRVSVRGGFVELYRLSFQSDEMYDLHYYDANSLYPWIAQDTLFPLGEYKIILEKDLHNSIQIKENKIFYLDQSCDSDVAMVAVLAPSDLSKPFLPYRYNDQVFYGNCFSCIKTKHCHGCTHKTINKRRFVSVWTVLELEYSLTLGYKILYFYELYHYERQDKVMSDFVTAMASYRLKNSNLLANVPVAQHDQFCKNLNAKMKFLDPNLQLKPSNVVDNKPQKEFFKSLLNGVLGRFALHSNFSNRVFLRSQYELDALMANPNIEILEFFPLGSLMEVETMRNSALNTSKEGCLFYTALINAKSRIYMHQLIMKLEQEKCQPIYCDTDSLLFAAPKNYKCCFEIGPAFGQFKPVLGESAKIKKFYSLGPKNYTLLYEKDGVESYVTKIKGLSIGCDNLQNVITPTTYEQFLASYFEDEVMKTYIPQQRQAVNPATKSFKYLMLSQKFENELHLKRFILKKHKSHVTYPYGYNFFNHPSI